MKVVIVGGGPSGLYLGLLLKRHQRSWQVDVIEQNGSNSTFGFGVALADTGLLQLQEADRSSYTALCAAMHYSERQVIVHRETPIEYTLNVKSGAIPRLKLLQILEAEAQSAGVRIFFGKRIESSDDLGRLGLGDADVVV